MRVIYKYPLTPGDNMVKLPKTGAKILHVDNQHNTITMWIELDNTKPTYERTFTVIPTGVAMVPDSMRYLGTAILDSGYKVWHVYGQ